MEGTTLGQSRSRGFVRKVNIWDDEGRQLDSTSSVEKVEGHPTVAGHSTWRAWALLANSRVYDVESAARNLEVDSWRLPKGQVRIGDRLAFWRTKGSDGQRGIVAFGEVTAPVAVQAPNPQGRKFWPGGIPAEMASPQPRFWLRYILAPNLPLWLDEDEEVLLRSLSVARGQGTKLYTLTPEQWQALEGKAGGWSASRPGPPIQAGPGSEYRAPARPNSVSAGENTLILQVDPAKAERALQSHGDLQEHLRRELEHRSLKPLPPGPDEPEYDLAWVTAGTLMVVEIKSVTDVNEVAQLRQGLGQVLHYRAALRQLYPTHAVRAALLIERAPGDTIWSAVCEQAGVDLVWPPDLERLFQVSGGLGIADATSKAES